MSLHNIHKVLSRPIKESKKQSVITLEKKKPSREEYEQAYIDKVLLRPLKKSIQKISQDARKPVHKP